MSNGEIDEATLTQLIDAVTETGKYTFLIGAGSSKPKPAGIPTGGELTDRWREECFEREDPDEDLETWVGETESTIEGEETEITIEVDDDEITIHDEPSRYGFWFEERHRTPGQRRECIEELVEEATPTLGHIILATMMSEGYVPHVLTPNFDDLLFDAFYLYLEDKPQLVNHQAVAPEFKLTRERSAIVKLHGDYLYDNLQNTKEETESLESGMEEALERTVNEYGLVVVGYSGCDESIMGPFLEADLSGYGVYWCVRNPDALSENVEEFLERENTYLVEIDGFVELMVEFDEAIDDVELPERKELVKRAKERADQIDDALEKYGEVADEEEGTYVEKQQMRRAATEAYFDDEYRRAIELCDEVIALDSEDATAYCNRGIAKRHLGEYESAIEDFDRAIDLDPKYATAYYNRGLVKNELGEYETAIEDYDQAIGLDPGDAREDARAHYNRGLTKRKLGECEAAIEDYDRALDLYPGGIPPLLNRAEARIETGEYQKARQDALEAHSLSDSPDESAVSLLFLLISTTLLGEDTDDLEEEYRTLCNEDFTTTWDFDELDSWLESADLDADTHESIAEWIDLLREHEPE